MAVSESRTGEQGRAPVHLWIVGVLSLLWNLGGVWDYTATKLRVEAYLSKFPEEVLTFVDAMPAWATAVWALGVWGAFAGSVALLLRKRWAVWAFAVSLTGLFFSTIYGYVLSNGAELMGTGGMIMNLAIWVIAIFLLVYSHTMGRRDVIT